MNKKFNLPDIKKVSSAAQASEAGEQLFKEMINYFRIRQEEKTKRHIMDKKTEVIIEYIRTERNNFKDYIEKIFTERAMNYEKFFDLLDKGIDNGDINVIGAAVSLITSQIKENPLNDYKDFKKNLFKFDEIEEF